MYISVDAHFGRKAQQQEEAEQYEKKRVSKLEEKPLNLNGRNNGSQVQKIVNEPQRKQWAQRSSKKEVVNPWALYEIESKQEWAKET